MLVRGEGVMLRISRVSKARIAVEREVLIMKCVKSEQRTHARVVLGGKAEIPPQASTICAK